ncbi:MAG: 23S rRNA (pseudouridine(1915)-N(3))-methyltransferase RlmH [Actinomycetota bacterium]
MKLAIVAVGRAKPGPEQDLLHQYLRRIQPAPAIREVEEKRALPTAQLKAREAELLLAQVPAGAPGVALDERGAEIGSEDFARRLEAWRDAGVPEVAFLIGGADGHGQAVRDRADFTLALGKMTWPHMLVRALLAEQLWRAQAISSRHPYHRA